MTKGSDQTNPLREGLSTRAVPQPCAIVIFGATGDLTHRKLIPALYNLAAAGELPPAVTVVGFARRPKSDDEFRKELEKTTKQFSRQDVREDIWKTFSQSLFYHQSEFENESGYQSLAQRLNKIDEERGTRGNRLFYLAAAPEKFEPILKNLKAAGLNKAKEGSWARVIIEKPFGRDLASAQELNRIVSNAFAENQTYRIDHFLGKETAQNILVLRFANAIFEPIWNARYIDHVQITAAETLGVEGRAGYYETAGALRDMVQNHLLQLLCLVAMEAPTDLSADSIRDEKVKVVRSLRRYRVDDIAKLVVRGQYTSGAINAENVPGYREEEKVDPKSETDSFVALRMMAKIPGTSLRIEPVKMDFHYGTSFGKASPEAYERLLLDAMSGDATLFARRDEVEEAWAFIDPIEEIWHAKKDVPELFFYPAGSWGPEAADDLLARDGRAWRRL